MSAARRSSTSASRAGSASRSVDVGGELPATSETTATASARSWPSRTSAGSSDAGQRPLGDGAGPRWRPAAVLAAQVAGDVADQRQAGLVGGRAQRVGVAPAARPGCQGVVLTRLGGGLLDLLQTVPQDVGLLGELPGLAAAGGRDRRRARASGRYASR